MFQNGKKKKKGQFEYGSHPSSGGLVTGGAFDSSIIGIITLLTYTSQSI
jgi:hypothetical protein